MVRGRVLGFVVGVVLVLPAALMSGIGCEKKAPPADGRMAPRGLPAPEDQAEHPEAPASAAALPADPHAGIDMGSGSAPGSDPHAGMAVHGGGSGPVDPTLVLEGTIEVAPSMADKVKPGDVVFLSAKAVDGSGQAKKSSLAVDRLELAAAGPLAFRLTGANSMGGKLEGKVLLVARVDKDREAMTREAGDVEGQVLAVVPQKGLKIVLDTPVTP